MTERVVPKHGGKIEIFKSNMNGDWYLRIKGRNGEILATSEGHARRIDVMYVRERYFRDWDLEVL